MGKRHFKVEDIIHKLREADVLLSQGSRWPKCAGPRGYRM